MLLQGARERRRTTGLIPEGKHTCAWQGRHNTHRCLVIPSRFPPRRRGDSIAGNGDRTCDIRWRDACAQKTISFVPRVRAHFRVPYSFAVIVLRRAPKKIFECLRVLKLWRIHALYVYKNIKTRHGVLLERKNLKINSLRKKLVRRFLLDRTISVTLLLNYGNFEILILKKISIFFLYLPFRIYLLFLNIRVKRTNKYINTSIYSCIL